MKSVPLWVKILVVWHVFCISVWACPRPNEAMDSGRVIPSPLAVGDWTRLNARKNLQTLAILNDYLFAIGAWQYWDMFAPNPADTDWYGEVIVHYKNGREKRFDYPRMYKLGLPQKYIEERFRKFYERAHANSDLVMNTSYFLNPFVYTQALENFDDPSNPPVRVDLLQHSKVVSAPGQPEAKDYTDQTYFVGEIDPGILESMAKSSRNSAPGAK